MDRLPCDAGEAWLNGRLVVSPLAALAASATRGVVGVRDIVNRWVREAILVNHSVKKIIEFCYGHRLLDYDGKCRHLHGHNGQLEIEVVSGSLDPLGMVIDFGQIKELAKGWVDENLDHKMVLHRNDPIAQVLQDCGEPLYLMDCNPTAENIAQLIFQNLSTLGLHVSRITLWETPSSCATYTED